MSFNYPWLILEMTSKIQEFKHVYNVTSRALPQALRQRTRRGPVYWVALFTIPNKKIGMVRMEAIHLNHHRIYRS